MRYLILSFLILGCTQEQPTSLLDATIKSSGWGKVLEKTMTGLEAEKTKYRVEYDGLFNEKTKPVEDMNASLETKEEFLFKTKGFSFIMDFECKGCHINKEIPPCHFDKDDPGLDTCAGISRNAYPLVYVDLLNTFMQRGEQMYFGQVCFPSNFWKIVKDFYYKKYFSGFKDCGWPRSFILTDSAIPMGVQGAVKTLQMAEGLAVDGLFGPISRKACESFDIQKFHEIEQKRFKSFKKCFKFCPGWLRRSKKRLEDFNDEN